jgi:hypothetical protein
MILLVYQVFFDEEKICLTKVEQLRNKIVTQSRYSKAIMFSLIFVSIRTMPITQFEQRLFQKLHPLLGNYGFDLMPERKQFRKNTSIGFENIILSVSNYDEESLVEVNFGCRHHEIEKVAQQFLTNSPEYWQEANTLIISIGKYNEAKYFRYKVFDEEDLETVCQQIEHFFTDRGFTLLSEFSGLKAVDEILNKEPQKQCRFVYNQTHRCFKGLIAAKLTNRENFFDLAETYRKSLIKLNASIEELHQYERLLSYLLYHSVN